MVIKVTREFLLSARQVFRTDTLCCLYAAGNEFLPVGDFSFFSLSPPLASFQFYLALKSVSVFRVVVLKS